MDSYSANKIKIIKFAGKWVETKTIIQSEVTQTQKDRYRMFYLFIDVTFELSDTCVSFGISTEVSTLLRAHGECRRPRGLLWPQTCATAVVLNLRKAATF